MLLRNSLIYVMTNIINSSIPFFLLPILTRFLSPNDYGVVSLFGIFLSVLSVFIGLNVFGAISRQYYEKEHIHFPSYVGNSFYILIGSTIFILVIVFFFNDMLSNFFSISTSWIWIAVLIALSQSVIQILLVIWQVEGHAISYGTFQIAQTSINAILSIFFVVSLKMGWEGRIIAQAFAIIVFSCLAFIVLLKNDLISWKIDFTMIRHALTFGIPLIPHALGGMAIAMSDRLLMNYMYGTNETGIYAVGVQLGMLIGILTLSFNQAFVPWLYKELKSITDTKKIRIVRMTYLYNIAIVVIALLFSWIAPSLLSFLIGKDFQEASVYILWIALGNAFGGMYYMVTNYISYENKNYLLAITTLAAAALNVIFVYFLMKINGPVGAAQGTMLAYLCLFLFTWILSQKVYPMPWIYAIFKKEVHNYEK